MNWTVLLAIALVFVVVIVVWRARRRTPPALGARLQSGACPDVSDNVLPQCELERRRPEAGRTYCRRGVCGPGLEAVPDAVTAYTICVPEGKTVEEACPY